MKKPNRKNEDTLLSLQTLTKTTSNSISTHYQQSIPLSYSFIQINLLTDISIDKQKRRKDPTATSTLYIYTPHVQEGIKIKTVKQRLVNSTIIHSISMIFPHLYNNTVMSYTPKQQSHFISTLHETHLDPHSVEKSNRNPLTSCSNILKYTNSKRKKILEDQKKVTFLNFFSPLLFSSCRYAQRRIVNSNMGHVLTRSIPKESL